MPIPERQKQYFQKMENITALPDKKCGSPMPDLPQFLMYLPELKTINTLPHLFWNTIKRIPTESLLGKKKKNSVSTPLPPARYFLTKQKFLYTICFLKEA